MSNVDQPSPAPPPPPPPRRWSTTETWTLGVFSLVGLIGFIATFVLIVYRSPDAQAPRALTAAEMQSFVGKPGPPGERGAAGPQGLRGPAGDAGVRILRLDCAVGNCAVECAADEVLLNAYCGPNRVPAAYPTEHSAACRVVVGRGRVEVVAACVKAPRR